MLWPVTLDFDGKLAGELLVVLAHLAGLHGVFEDDEGAVEGERFFKEVVGAELGGAHSGFDGAVAADDDDLGDVGGVHLADLVERVEAVAVGEPDVEQDDVVGGVAEEGEGFCGGGGGGDEVVLFFEDGFERVADLGLVVDDEDVVQAVVSGGGLSGVRSGSTVGARSVRRSEFDDELAPAGFVLFGADGAAGVPG